MINFQEGKGDVAPKIKIDAEPKIEEMEADSNAGIVQEGEK